jgi:hypothetical protein
MEGRRYLHLLRRVCILEELLALDKLIAVGDQFTLEPMGPSIFLTVADQSTPRYLSGNELAILSPTLHSNID